MSKTIVKLFLLLIVLTAMFYWFQWRPRQIKIGCNKYAEKLMKGGWLDDYSDYNFVYKVCLDRKGL